MLLSTSIGCTERKNEIPVSVLPQLVSAAARVEETPLVPIEQHIRRSIAVSQTKLNSGEIQLLVPMLSGIAEQVFQNRTHQEYWISLLGVESMYDQRLKSHAGAVGLGQLMPKYYKDIAATCGIKDLPSDTVGDRYINAYLSACYFSYLIKESEGIISLALVAYNAGINSSSYKKANAGGVPVQETAGYVTKVTISKQKVSEK